MPKKIKLIKINGIKKEVTKVKVIDKNLGEILTKTELNKIKTKIEKQLKRKFTHPLKDLRKGILKYYYGSLEEINDVDDLKNICNIVADKKIIKKIQENLKSV